MEMPTYHVVITKYTALRTYSQQVVFSGFIESELTSAEEVKQRILAYHKKKRLKGYEVTVTSAGQISL